MGLTKFEKLFISLRYYLLAAAKFDPSYLHALDALEFAKEIHVGTRKDGFTPEFQHQLEIAHFIRTLNVRFPAATIAVVLLHDVLEDYSDKAPFVTKEQIYSRFGQQIGDACVLISKEYQGVKTPTKEYYDRMALCPIVSLAKGGDRVHNQSSMANVFTKTKQVSYTGETKDYVLPMLKVARRIHFDQEAAYENIKFVLQSQITFVEAYNKNEDTASCDRIIDHASGRHLRTSRRLCSRRVFSKGWRNFNCAGVFKGRPTIDPRFARAHHKQLL